MAPTHFLNPYPTESPLASSSVCSLPQWISCSVEWDLVCFSCDYQQHNPLSMFVVPFYSSVFLKLSYLDVSFKSFLNWAGDEYLEF